MTGTLMVLVGPPGAGKTTWRHTQRPDVVVSLDANRALVSCCSGDEAATPLATALGVTATRAVLARGGWVLWDITAAMPSTRAWLLVLAAEYQARAVAVVMVPPLPVVLARNATRDPRPCPVCGHARRVPDAVITAWHTAISRDRHRLAADGWDTVVMVDACRMPTDPRPATGRGEDYRTAVVGREGGDLS